MKKFLFLLLAFSSFLAPVNAYGQWLERNNLWYVINILNDGTSYAAVTFHPFDLYEGVVSPESVITYENKAYTVTHIDTKAFDSCVGLTGINIPPTVTTIQGCAFYGCTGLRSIVLPESVTFIEDAFYYCSNLETIEMGSNVQTILSNGFTGCVKLQNFICRTSTPPQCFPNAFAGINMDICTLYVPEESVPDYRKADQWKEFFHIEGIPTSGVDAESADAVHIEKYYDTFGNCYDEPRPGLMIVKSSDGSVKKVLYK